MTTLTMPTRRASPRPAAPPPAPKNSIARLVDAIDAPVALVDREGSLAAMNGPARDFFMGRIGLLLREAIEQAARAALDDRRSADGAPNRAHAIQTAHHRFVATIVPAGQDLAMHDIGAMVLLRRESLGFHAPPASEAALMSRFGLTPQEARVAALLADHRSNRDIADRLGVSTHTARHHTERVLAKLHVHSRYDVRRVIS